MTSVLGFPGGSAGKESACNVGDLGLVPGLGISLGEGKGYQFQYSVLENSMDCIVHGVTKSWTQLGDFHFHFKWVIYPHFLFDCFFWKSQLPCCKAVLWCGLCEWAWRKSNLLRPANCHMSEFERRYYFSWALKWLQPWLASGLWPVHDPKLDSLTYATLRFLTHCSCEIMFVILSC